MLKERQSRESLLIASAVGMAGRLKVLGWRWPGVGMVGKNTQAIDDTLGNRTD